MKKTRSSKDGEKSKGRDKETGNSEREEVGGKMGEGIAKFIAFRGRAVIFKRTAPTSS